MNTNWRLVDTYWLYTGTPEVLRYTNWQVMLAPIGSKLTVTILPVTVKGIWLAPDQPGNVRELAIFSV